MNNGNDLKLWEPGRCLQIDIKVWSELKIVLKKCEK